MTGMKCQQVLQEGAFGPTVAHETDSVMCPNEATWSIERPGVRPRFRCDDHAEAFRALIPSLPDLTVTAIQERPR